METRQDMLFKNTMIRGIKSMLSDVRMERQDEAYQYLMDVTGSTTEDDIFPLLRSKTPEEAMKINIEVSKFLKQYTWITGTPGLTAEIYDSYGPYKGD